MSLPRMTRFRSAVLVAAVLLACGSVDCTNGAPNPQTVQSITAGVQLALCVLNGYASDVQAGMSPLQITADLVAKCGADAATVATILDAQARAAQAQPAAKK